MFKINFNFEKEKKNCFWNFKNRVVILLYSNFFIIYNFKQIGQRTTKQLINFLPYDTVPMIARFNTAHTNIITDENMRMDNNK